MAEAPRIFVVGGDHDPMGRLVPRLRALGTEVVPVQSIGDAIQQLDDRARTLRLVFFPIQPPPQDGKLLGSIRKASRRTGARFVAVGPSPSAAERKILESAGVESCLCEPIAETQLRFAINQAGYEPGDGKCRKSVRAPTAMTARIVTDVGEQDALVYSLSAGGAYAETPRAMTAGAQVKIELPLPCGTVAVDARVLYHNVVGNLKQENLAVGMGVEFIEVDEATRATLADYVEECLTLQTGREQPKRSAAPREEEAQPKERRQYPRLGLLKRIGRQDAREKAEPDRIPAVEQSPPTKESPKPEGNPTNGANKVVVRCRDGRVIKGYLFDFLPQKDVFHVVSPNDGNEITELMASEPKAIFFVKSFDGDRDGAEPKSVTMDELRALPGVKLAVRFHDGEVMCGTTHGYQPGRKGFFVFPADETSNNTRIYIYEDATESVEVLR